MDKPDSTDTNKMFLLIAKKYTFEESGFPETKSFRKNWDQCAAEYADIKKRGGTLVIQPDF